VDSESNLIAVKTSKNPGWAELIRREADILKSLKHPLVVELRVHTAELRDHNSSIMTEYAGNGSLANFLMSGGERRLSGATRIAKVITGIALAMRFVHSRGVIHRDLRPENILVDWDWTVRLADFGHSASPDAPSPIRVDGPIHWPSINSRYLAPECYEGSFGSASDVFAFGLILFEILTGHAAFSAALRQHNIAYLVAVDGVHPEIPDFVVPLAGALIRDCWASDPDDRPTFEDIVTRLGAMEFKVIADVKSAKVAAFVKGIESWETLHVSE
jgi:serine/threonine protein kinase